MKRIVRYLFLLLSFNLLTFNIFSQCEPMTPEQCPDPENNGQICPDSLETAFINQFYSQVATIKPPENYYLPPDSTLINLHHVKLLEVGNLPSGLTWQSNTTDSVFIAGEYYCVLLEGTPDSVGLFPLKITVEVYILFGPTPILAGTVTDSTSLYILVIDNSGVDDKSSKEISVSRNVPNPFNDITRIGFYSDKNEQVDFEVFSLQGQKIYHEKIDAHSGENIVVFDGTGLAPGMYYYLFRKEGLQVSGKMVRSSY